MSDWPTVELGDVASIQQGRYLAKNEMAESRSETAAIPVHGANGIIGWTDSPTYEHGVALVTCRGSNSGMVLWAEGPLWVSNNAMAIVPKEEDARFLFYVLTCRPPYSVVTGSAQPQITRRDLAPYLVTWPPRSARRAIGPLLASLDDKIELNRRMNETLEAVARAIFRDWFVDFGPTRAKMAGAAPYLTADLWEAFPDRLDDEGKPEGWRIEALSEVTSELRRGISPNYLTEGGVRVLNQKCVRDRTVSFKQARRHDPEAKSISGRELVQGDILVNSTGVGTLGRVAQVWRIEEVTVVDSHVTVVRADAKQLSPVYLGLDLTSREPEIEALGEGSTGQTELSRHRLGQLNVVVPGSTVMKVFEAQVGPLLQRRTANEKENETLAQTRDLLLPKLMSGEIRLKDAEPIQEDAA